MADSRTTKIVEYQLQGNTVDLESKLKAAISTLDQLDQKLTKVSSASLTDGRSKQTLSRATNISTAQTQAAKLKGTLSSGNITGVSPDQLNLLNQLSIELDKASAKLGTFDKAGKVSNTTIQKTKVLLKQANLAVRNSGMAAQEAAKGWKVLGTAVTKLLVLRMVTQLLVKGYKEAMKFVETVNLFNVATKESADALGQFAEKLADAYNTDIGPLYNSIAIFKQYANTMGMAATQADLFGTELTKLGMDLASLYNTSNAEMFNALKSGLAGLTKPLMRYGISVHKATLEQEALALGLNKSWNEFTEAEKVALRYIAIMKQTTAAQGDLARTLESPENQLKITKAQLQIFIRNLGSLVTMISKFVLPVFNGLMIAVNNFLAALTKAAGYVIPDYSENLSSNNQMLEEGTEDAEDYADAMNGVMAPLDEINQANTKKDEGPGGIDPKILEALKGYDNLMSMITTKTDEFGEIFGRIFNPTLFEGIGTIIGVVFETFGQGLEIVTQLLDTFSPVLDVVFKVLGYILQGIGWLLDKVVSPIMAFITALTSNIWLLIAAFAALNLIQLAVTGNFSSMMIIKMAQWFIGLTAKIWANVTAFIAQAAATIKAKVASIAMAAVLWWETAAWWQKAIAVIAAAGALALVVAGIVLAATSSVQSQADSAQPSGSPPAMATGGVVSNPTMAIIGEGRYNEAVVPLGNSPQFKTMKEDIAGEVLRNLAQTPLAAASQQSRGNAGHPVILNINGREIARAILPDLNIAQPQTGVRLK